ncbi:SNF2 family N-terminal domain-containing protein [Lentinula aff. detonsa]|uniref:Helicase SWR1 n=1 Tax=Lentinula aff. detonsa TaxID=2804958 RepID=A0AA38NR78_9AGAR|nr:SNF2 family N-terminal domain-containing protein [Lentinula aff. detonsa]
MFPSASKSGESRRKRHSRGSTRETVSAAKTGVGHEFEARRGEKREENRRNLLISEKEAELTQIYEGHDSLVREAFHMEHFRMMLSYDPVEAKQDNSAVFQHYKSKYDLLEAAPDPFRRTRRARNERKSLVLPASLDTPPSGSMSASISLGRKGKTSRNHFPLDQHSGAGAKAQEFSSIQGVNSSSTSKANGKRKANPTQDARSSGPIKSRGRKRYRDDAIADSGSVEDSNAYMDLASTITHIHSNHTSIPVPLPKGTSGIRLRVPARTNMNVSSSEPISVTECNPIRDSSKVTLRVLRSNVERSSSTSILTSLPSLPAGSQPPRVDSINQSQSALPVSNVPPQSLSLTTHSCIPAKRKITSADSEQSSLSFIPPVNSVASIQSLPLPIKRIKLIVRPPPPLITGHLQRPLPPKHKYSLSDFLSSYTTDGFEEVSPDVLAERARTRAKFLERTRRLREEGFLLGDPSVLELTPTEAANKQRKSSDIWHHCLQDAAVYIESKSEEPSGVEIASQIANAVEEYWDVQTAKQEKMRAREEKRIRALAKATIKLVTAEWRKAVFHLREQWRLKLEAEEAKRGRAHLDAILDQSGHILETQRGDLTRADRSRSHSRGSSISNFTDHSEDDDDDNSDEESEEEQDDESKGVNDGEDEGEGEKRERILTVPLEDSFCHIQSEPPIDDEEAPPALLDIFTDEQGGLQVFDTSSSDEPSYQISQSSPTLVDKSAAVAVFTHSQNQVRNTLHTTHQEKSFVPVDLDQLSDGGASSPRTADAVTPPDDFEAGSLTITVIERSVPNVEMASLQHNDSMSASLPMKVNSDRLGVEAFATAEVDVANIDNQPPTTVDTDNLTLASSNSNGDLVEPTSFEAPDEEDSDDSSQADQLPAYLKPYAVTHIDWNPDNKIAPPVLLRGVLRPYQFSGLEWLASLHSNNLNGILADEMGLGKTIQTISLLAHLACDRGIWGPHLIIVPTSVLLNWEMEFKKFLPGFKILCYHGTTKRRKELRHGWNDKYHFNVCITSYTIASRDAHIFKRKNWYYMVLDEAHMIKNFRSQRWNTLLLFRSFRRLLLTGTPLQNNLTELWALLQFLMSGAKFANLKEFGEWFSNPLEKAIEMGNVLDDETKQRVSKLHTVLRPYLLRRLKRDVEKELPNKYEHLVLCSLSKRQRFLYDEFMARAHTRDALQSGVYQKIANVLMQLRKVCNHPDLFEVRPVVTSFMIDRSAIADFEITELFIRQRLLNDESEELNLELLGLSFVSLQNISAFTTLGTRAEAAGAVMMQLCDDPGPAPPRDVRTIKGFRKYSEWQRRASLVARWSHTAYLNRLRYSRSPIYSSETISLLRSMHNPIYPLCHVNKRTAAYVDSVLTSVHRAVLSYEERSNSMADVTDRFAFITPSVVARDVARIALAGVSPSVFNNAPLTFDQVVHKSNVKLTIAFPSPSLLQYDCGKLQRLTSLLREKKAGGHRVLLFTQMTRVLDILEIYLNFHGYLYLRLDGATSIEDRQYVTERFNKDERIFCFIASSRSGGVGINLTGADTVIFYDSDFNPQMDRQCEDRAHRIGQIRDVHIYRFVSEHTVEEAMLLKANQKRSLDDMVIQKGEFDWRSIFKFDSDDESSSIAVDRVQRGFDSGLLTKALGEFEDSEDALAARMAEREEVDMEGADEADFGLGAVGGDEQKDATNRRSGTLTVEEEREGDNEDEEEDGGTTVEYMLAFIDRDPEFFAEWRL